MAGLTKGGEEGLLGVEAEWTVSVGVGHTIVSNVVCVFSFHTGTSQFK